MTKYNSAEAYDKLWGDKDLLKHYLEPARLEAYMVIIDFILKQHYGPKIVELGFGSADFLKTLLNKAVDRKFEVFGLDYALSGVERAQKLIPEGSFTHGDIYHLPYENNFFDQVYCIQTLEHLKEPEQALSEMDRVCKPNGMILLTIPNGDLDKFEGHINFWSEPEFIEFLSPREINDFIRLNEDRAMMTSIKPMKGL